MCSFMILYAEREILSFLRKYLKVPIFYIKIFSTSRYLIPRDTSWYLLKDNKIAHAETQCIGIASLAI